MTFTNKLPLLMTISLLMLSGCASFTSLFPDTAKQARENEIQQSPVLAPHIQQETLDPIQRKILALKAKPNLYLSGQPPIDTSTLALYGQALQAKKRRDLKQAETLLTTLTQTQPTLSGPWVQLADLKMLALAEIANHQEQVEQDLLVDAQRLYEKALAINPHNYFAHNRLARVLREQGQFEQAQHHYKQAIASWPGYDNSYLNLGILYDLYMGKKRQALREYELYQALQPEPVRQVRGWIADLKRQVQQADRTNTQGDSE
jgi:tetratricopeptide (TPR) repeat protein